MTRHTNLFTAWVDNRKAYDSMPQILIEFNSKPIAQVNIKCRIYQVDALSPLLFSMDLNPCSQIITNGAAPLSQLSSALHNMAPFKGLPTVDIHPTQLSLWNHFVCGFKRAAPRGRFWWKQTAAVDWLVELCHWMSCPAKLKTTSDHSLPHSIYGWHHKKFAYFLRDIRDHIPIIPRWHPDYRAGIS